MCSPHSGPMNAMASMAVADTSSNYHCVVVIATAMEIQTKARVRFEPLFSDPVIISSQFSTNLVRVLLLWLLLQIERRIRGHYVWRP